MAFRYKINSLRCKKWFGFAKQKLGVWKSVGLILKAYLIDGYKIVLKPQTDLAIITAPPGIVIFRKGPGEVTLYDADMFGQGREQAVEIETLRGITDEPPMNPMDDGWPGAILPFALGGDEINIFWGARPDASKPTPSYFTTRSSMGMRVLAVAPYAFRILNGFVNVVSGVTLPHVFALASTGQHYVYGIFGENRLSDYGFPAIYFGSGGVQPGSTYQLDYPIEIPVGWLPNSTGWSRKYCQYLYPWVTHNATKNRKTVTMLAYIQGVYPGFNVDDVIFLFMEFDPVDQTIYYNGYTDAEGLDDLDPDLPGSVGGRTFGIYYKGAPETQAQDATGFQNIVFPISNDVVGIAHYDSTSNITISVASYDSYAIETGYSFPYTWDPFIFPFCVVLDPSYTYYMYWEESLLFGGEETDIINWHTGAPNSGWVPMPTPGPGLHVTSFTPIKVTPLHKIILATVFQEGDPISGGGMYTALLDTDLSSSWIIGKRFAETRVDRCSATVFGDHPYVEERKKYMGTQWGWDYSYCENYPEPPGGYPS